MSVPTTLLNDGNQVNNPSQLTRCFVTVISILYSTLDPHPRVWHRVQIQVQGKGHFAFSSLPTIENFFRM